MKRVKSIIAYADVGSHGGIFEFYSGPIADRYPSLLQIYRRQVTPDLVPVVIKEMNKRKKGSKSK